MTQLRDYISPPYQCSYCGDRFFSLEQALEHVQGHYIRKFFRRIGDYVWGRS